MTRARLRYPNGAGRLRPCAQCSAGNRTQLPDSFNVWSGLSIHCDKSDVQLLCNQIQFVNQNPHRHIGLGGNFIKLAGGTINNSAQQTRLII